MSAARPPFGFELALGSTRNGGVSAPTRVLVGDRGEVVVLRVPEAAGVDAGRLPLGLEDDGLDDELVPRVAQLCVVRACVCVVWCGVWWCVWSVVCPGCMCVYCRHQRLGKKELNKEFLLGVRKRGRWPMVRGEEG